MTKQGVVDMTIDNKLDALERQVKSLQQSFTMACNEVDAGNLRMMPFKEGYFSRLLDATEILRAYKSTKRQSSQAGEK
jgi:hypothetical protein